MLLVLKNGCWSAAAGGTRAVSQNLEVLPVFLSKVVNECGKMEAEPNCVNSGHRRRREFSKLNMNYIL